jgi:uncharacterized protein YecA (UPF0149 family)
MHELRKVESDSESDYFRKEEHLEAERRKREKKLLTSQGGQIKKKAWMRNKPCLCGSGKKFKKCCWGNYR